MAEGNGNGWLRTIGVLLGGAAAGLGANLGQSYLSPRPEPAPVYSARADAFGERVVALEILVQGLRSDLVSGVYTRMAPETREALNSLDRRVGKIEERP